MKLVIDIPDDVYKRQDFVNYYGAWSGRHQKTISDGQPLSEVLDKISAEIDGLHQKPVGFENEYEGGYNHAVDSVLDVIEKYKGVSEC